MNNNINLNIDIHIIIRVAYHRLVVAPLACVIGWLAGWPRPRPHCFRKSMNMHVHLNLICYDMFR